MLWYSAFAWQPQTTRRQIAERILRQHDAGLNRLEQIRGWYNPAGGGVGFMLLNADDPREVTAFLQPCMDLVSWDVRAVHGLRYDRQIEDLRKILQEGT